MPTFTLVCCDARSLEVAWLAGGSVAEGWRLDAVCLIAFVRCLL